nr:SE1832 family protein [Lysinibacillus timonensis]
MLSKKELEQQIAELKMDYINLQGDMEKLEQTGHAGSVAQSVERLEKMEKQLAELNKQLAALS